MINCQDAKHLFDRYLDGELSPSLHTELNAHRLNCTSCQSELAMLETCGSVIAMDHCEPELSASFTDRVLLAQRTHARPRPRRWVRRIVVIGSPLAAAASIAVAVVMMHRTNVNQKTTVAAAQVAMPKKTQELLREQVPTHTLSPKAQKELDETPVDDFLDAGLAKLKEKFNSTLESTRRSEEEFANLLHQGWSDTNNKLMAEYKTLQTAPQDAIPNESPDAAPFNPDPANPDSADLPNDNEHVLQPL